MENSPKKHPFLEKALSPLKKYLEDPAVSEISINGPGGLFLERMGHSGMAYHNIKEITTDWIGNLGQLVAGSTDQMISSEKPILSAALPTGERFQCVLPPAAPDGGAISIRKQTIMDVTLAEYTKRGAFKKTKIGNKLVLSEGEESLLKILSGNPVTFLREAIIGRVSMVVSGGTSTGKTTFLNALLKEIPDDERIITIEDTRELTPTTKNSVALVASKGEQGTAKVTTQELLEASLRMRPDRLMLGELRGVEAYSFLQAINTGHPGSLTTVHANSARSAYERLALMVMQAGLGLTKSEIIDYLKDIIPIVVQLTRNPDGKRVVTEIFFSKAGAS